MESGDLTQRPSTPTGTSLIGLPRELLCEIRDWLPVESRNAFALTCTGIFEAIGIRQLKPKSVTKLLLLLERDSPNRFVCFGCKKLRRLVRHPTRGWVNKGHKRCGDHRIRRFTFFHEHSDHQGWVHLSRITTYRIRSNLHSWQPRKTCPKISFSEAHLVMSRHLYGPRYGLSLDILKHEFNFETFIRLWNHIHFPLDKHPPDGLRPEEQGDVNQCICQEAPMRANTPAWLRKKLGLTWSFSHKYNAMIVEDELHVVRLHQVCGMPVQRCNFQSLMHWIHLPICNHLAEEHPWEYENSINTWYILLSKALGGSVIDGIGDVFAGNVAAKYVDGSCSHCFTDYELLIERDEDVWTLKLATYHRLGRCQTPDDPIWQCLASPSRKFSIGREEVDPSFGPGRTREKWYEALKGMTKS